MGDDGAGELLDYPYILIGSREGEKIKAMLQDGKSLTAVISFKEQQTDRASLKFFFNIELPEINRIIKEV